MGLILSEPMMKKVVEIPKIFAKFSVEDAKFAQNALTGSAHRPGEKGEKKTKNRTSAVFSLKKLFF
jgi:hypothetical protein